MPRGYPKNPRTNAAGRTITTNQAKYNANPPAAINAPAPSEVPATVPEAEATQALVFDSRPPGEDMFMLTPEEVKAYGITAEQEYVWIRDPRVWEEGQRLAPGRVREFKQQNGGEIVKCKGDYVTCGQDLILAVRPKSLVEQKNERDRQTEKEYWGRVQRQKMEDDEFDPNDEDRLKQQMRRNSIENQQQGLIGPLSPSSGMPYEDYVRNRGLTARDIEQEELQYSLRRGGTELSEEQAEEVMRQNREQRRGAGGKFMSIPATVRPRNLASR